MKIGELAVINTFIVPPEGDGILVIVIEKDAKNMMTRVLLPSGRTEWYWNAELKEAT